VRGFSSAASIFAAMGTIDTSAGEVNIRLLRADEGDALRELRLEAIRTCPTAFGSDVGMTLATNWHERATMCDGSKDQAIFIAELGGDGGGAFGGMTGVYRQTSEKTRHACGIWGVYVRPQLRGRRVGEALLQAAVDWAAKHDGVTIVRLMVTVGNDAALACYRRRGFEITGKEIATIKVDGVEHDEYLMSRRLKAP
jgi:RimJ/RimL family protein N-acetyltransferase